MLGPRALGSLQRIRDYVAKVCRGVYAGQICGAEDLATYFGVTPWEVGRVISGVQEGCGESAMVSFCVHEFVEASEVKRGVDDWAAHNTARRVQAEVERRLGIPLLAEGSKVWEKVKVVESDVSACSSTKRERDQIIEEVIFQDAGEPRQAPKGL